MARKKTRTESRRAGSGQRDAKHRAGGDWAALSIPEGLEMWKPKEGAVRFDIVPYVVGEGNPYADQPGEWYYERTYWTHRDVGAGKETFVCPAKTAKKPCPICEYRAKLASDPDSDDKLVKSLKPKERQLFLIRLRTRGEELDPTVRLYETSFHTFGSLLDKRRQDAEEDESHITDFDDHKEGAVLKASYVDEDTGGFTYLNCYSIDFSPRSKGLESEVVEHGFCLDEIVCVPTYDELKRAFFEFEVAKDDESESEEEDTPKTETDVDDDWEDEDKPNPAQEAGLKVGMSVRHRKYGVCLLNRISGDGTSLILQEDDGETIHRAVEVKDVRIEEKESKKKEKKKAAPKDDDDDWEEEPKKEKKKAAPKDDGDDWEDEPKKKEKKVAPKDDDDWED